MLHVLEIDFVRFYSVSVNLPNEHYLGVGPSIIFSACFLNWTESLRSYLYSKVILDIG